MSDEPEATDEYAEDKRSLDSDLVKEYRDIFIVVENWDSFDRLDMNLNNLWEVDWSPDFVAEFERMLDSKPGLAPDVGSFLNSSVSLSILTINVGPYCHQTFFTRFPIPGCILRTA